MRLALECYTGDDWAVADVEGEYQTVSMATMLDRAKIYIVAHGTDLSGCTIIGEDRDESDEPLVEVRVTWFSDTFGWFIDGPGAGEYERNGR